MFTTIEQLSFFVYEMINLSPTASRSHATVVASFCEIKKSAWNWAFEK